MMPLEIGLDLTVNFRSFPQMASPSPMAIRRLVWVWFLTSCLEAESLARTTPFSSSFRTYRYEAPLLSAAYHGGKAERSTRLPMVTDMSERSSADSHLSRWHEIVVSAEIDLPFPVEIAYDAFSNMGRQTSWSPWLQSVEYRDESRNTTEWKMKFLGISARWISVCTLQKRPHCIAWESIQGLPNRGQVDFVNTLDDRVPDSDRLGDQMPTGMTRMKMTMSFQVPRLLARMFRSHGKVGQMVERRMLEPTLQRFCDDVLLNDYQPMQSTEAAGARRALNAVEASVLTP